MLIVLTLPVPAVVQAHGGGGRSYPRDFDSKQRPAPSHLSPALQLTVRRFSRTMSSL